ncbi:hypothetical protein BZJ19_10195 [Salinivibrio proteolyticus]|uniref:hypothetical protein n=1 Tax=Salinivibrio proteolyticus TaxID=334715 RepID=UPI00098926AB|nr:hypothetical protein [Salinivibrio proteolyticus]OOF25080.1 hypothetical protein BZJ19_10195 [Salinivibrio proteolyticus]
MKRNKRIKQSIVDVTLKGRKAYCYEDESEIYAAKSAEQIKEEFPPLCSQDEDDLLTELVSADWRYWWQPQLCEIGDKMVGKPAIGRDGTAIPHHELLPLICAVYGDGDDVCQVSTSYN